jgi:trehalose 6-phosphate phosphatase
MMLRTNSPNHPELSNPDQITAKPLRSEPRTARADLPTLTSTDAVFLDFDGTLVDLAERPDAVIVPPELPTVLHRLQQRLDGALAIVSGRTLDELMRFLHPADLTIIAEHGAVMRLSGDLAETTAPSWPSSWARMIEEFTSAYPGTFVELKSHSVAVHFRQAPENESAVKKFVAKLAQGHPKLYELLPAKMAFELKRIETSKGAGIRAAMQIAPFEGRLPVFIGDDVTDEPGFAAVEKLGGIALHVDRAFGGSPALVRKWLAEQFVSGRGA